MSETAFPAFVSARRLPNLFDVVAGALILAALIYVASIARGTLAPLDNPEAVAISLNPANLPAYAVRTTLRMFAALVCSLLFTLTYATWAAKSRRAGLVLIPVLDILQSVPILGFLTFTVVFFLGLFPGQVLGAELAAIFAIFTSQAWNMAFSLYQSLKTVPADLDEASRSLKLSAWQRFWRLEVPFAMPGLVWNTMMSMSGGWFFVVASEAISVGDITWKLPGIGSYVALALEERDIAAVFYAIGAMLVVILAYDQLLFRPLVAWSAKFRFELTASETAEDPWLLKLLRRTRVLRQLSGYVGLLFNAFGGIRLFTRRTGPARAARAPSRTGDAVYIAILAAGVVLAAWKIVSFASQSLEWSDLWTALELGLITLARVVVLMVLATLVWVPIGVWLGLRPRWGRRIQPVAQFLAAFPANLFFPIFVVAIVYFDASPDIWLTPLMILGTQWYILFNVHRGGQRLPGGPAGGCGQPARGRVAVVAPGHPAGGVPVLRDGGDHGLGRVLERGHRVGGGGLGEDEARRPRPGRLHRRRHGGGQHAPRRAGRRGHVVVRDRLQPPALAADVRLRQPPPHARIGTNRMDQHTAATDLLTVSHVRQAYHKDSSADLVVLDDVDLTLKTGEIVGLLGRSGSGKSTLLRIIAGLLSPTAGNVTWRGAPLHGPADGVAMVFQSFALFPWLTVQENVELGLEAQGVARAERESRAEAAIDLIGLGGYESAYPKELSGGMRQRVGLARALVVHPDLLLMDEPFSALDVLTAETLRTDLIDLWSDGRLPVKSVLMVTHNIEEAVLMCDRILVFSSNPGRVASELRVPFPHPRNRHDAAFRKLVDDIYALMTRRAATPRAAAPAPATIAMQLHRVSTNLLSGLAETLAAAPYYGRADLPALATTLQLELDDLLPLGEALQLLGLGVLEEGDLRLTDRGRQFVEAETDARKAIFAEALKANVPLVATIRRVLDERPAHRAAAVRFRDELEDFMSPDYADDTLGTAIAWGRYAELYSYDEEADQFFLDEAE